ncbi:MAG: ABC transporter substrate-binding protein, partial [Tissierellaceae bacterium]|nr:ABC transporter substrate-binding protein [Tissierellaceae bacterium]
MSKRLISLLLVGILVLSLAAGCGPKDVEEPAGGNESAGGEQQSGGDKVDTATKSNDQIVVALEADITSLDPQGHNDVISEKVSFLVFNRLFRLNENFEAVPDLAEDWSQPSEKEWLLKIKEGVKFHNGEEMTAEDVKFSMERSIESPKVQHVLEQLEKVEVVDKYTVKVTTKDVFAPFINTLVHAGISVIPKD